MKDKKRKSIRKINRLYRPIICLLLLFVSKIGYTQNSIPILGWRTHFSYNNIIDIASGDNKVFAASENALYYLDREDNSINLINKNTGLSDVGIGAITFDNSSNQLIIAYKNGNIDLWSEGNIKNVKTIKDAENIISKRLRDIQVSNNQLFISGDLGIVVYDLSRSEIIETYRNLGPNGEPLIIYQTAFTGDSIYAASESGILSSSLDNSINRQDFNNWERTLTGIEFRSITQFGNDLFASASSDLFTYQSGNWSFEQNFGENINELRLTGTELFILTEKRLIQNTSSGSSTLYTSSSDNQVLNSFFSEGSITWVSSSDIGLLRFNSFNAEPTPIKPPGPASDLILKPATFNSGIHWVSQGTTGSVSSFNLGTQEWSAFITKDLNGDIIGNLTDLDFGIVDGSNIQAPVFSSFQSGAFFGGDNNSSSISINQSFSNSSPLTTSGGSFNMTSLASQEGVLWITTSGFSNLLYSWNPSLDQWASYSLRSAIAPYPTDLLIAPDGYKWMSIEASRGGGIVVFDETTLRERHLNTNGGQGGLPGSEVTSMVVDQDFFIWVGTNQGIAFFPNPSIILENQAITANVPIFENRLLLRDEFITQITIDPANRKWFGTRDNGLWLFSETGEELVYHFTSENSPLPSNNIISLHVDPPSGELFIGTDRGMVSFRSDATEGTNKHVDVQMYPNPVNRSFQGNIVINGLANNALIKITDVSGKLVRQTRANGSTALWNSRDITGKRVSSGVYLVFSSSADGTETFVGKIVVI